MPGFAGILVFLVPIVLIVLAVEFGVWVMNGMLAHQEGQTHGSRKPLARAVGYGLGIVAFIAFLALATDARGWILLAIVVCIPLAIALAHRRR